MSEKVQLDDEEEELNEEVQQLRSNERKEKRRTLRVSTGARAHMGSRTLTARLGSVRFGSVRSSLRCR